MREEEWRVRLLEESQELNAQEARLKLAQERLHGSDDIEAHQLQRELLRTFQQELRAFHVELERFHAEFGPLRR